MHKGAYSIVGVLVLLSFASCSHSATKAWKDLIGPVSSIKVEVAEYHEENGEWREGDRKLHSLTTYGLKGERVEEVLYDSEGGIVLRTLWLTDSDGKYAGITARNVDKSHDYSSAATSDDKGRVGVERFYDAHGALQFTIKYVYDQNGRERQVDHYQPDGVLSSKLVTSYDEAGNRIEVDDIRADGTVRTKTSWRYDDKGALVEEDRDRGFIAVFGAWVPSRTVYTYDKEGKLKESTGYKADGSLLSREVYTCDTAGNWVKAVAFEVATRAGENSLAPTQCTYRLIEYRHPGVNRHLGILPRGRI